MPGSAWVVEMTYEKSRTFYEVVNIDSSKGSGEEEMEKRVIKAKINGKEYELRVPASKWQLER